MSFFRPLNTTYKLSGRVILVPVVSVGNVAQLAADLLIASLKLDRVGVFDPKYLVPVVGAREDSDGTDGLTTPIELFGEASNTIAVIQQRSPVLKSSKQQFTDTLLEFIRNSGVSAVIFMGGVDTSDRTDSQMHTPTTFILPPVSPPLDGGPLASLTDLPVPPYSSPLPRDLRSEGSSWPVPFIPGGGITYRLLSSIPDSWQIPTVGLLQYAMEGDNRLDAQLLATVAAKALGSTAVISTWTQPTAWVHGLFGTPHDQTLYG
ncbi:PAC2 family-domain-containing protein [Boletus reticuloceps]|uniref:Proteasome assembly chaperone 2 n=1 Tax=Boletus reticuloceps TaxID=495285 RepID=A0A8I3A314_9AGAM|nr:PAC2 family-domain-containing protein [Boletus reticuloceps]